jgi:hypothetical protein
LLTTIILFVDRSIDRKRQNNDSTLFGSAKRNAPRATRNNANTPQCLAAFKQLLMFINKINHTTTTITTTTTTTTIPSHAATKPRAAASRHD